MSNENKYWGIDGDEILTFTDHYDRMSDYVLDLAIEDIETNETVTIVEYECTGVDESWSCAATGNEMKYNILEFVKATCPELLESIDSGL